MATLSNKYANLIPLEGCQVQRMANHKIVWLQKNSYDSYNTAFMIIPPPFSHWIVWAPSATILGTLHGASMAINYAHYRFVFTAVQGCRIPYKPSFTWQVQRYTNQNQHGLIMLVQAIYNIQEWVVLLYLICNLCQIFLAMIQNSHLLFIILQCQTKVHLSSLSRHWLHKVKSIALWNQLHSLNVLCRSMQTIRLIIKQ